MKMFEKSAFWFPLALTNSKKIIQYLHNLMQLRPTDTSLGLLHLETDHLL